MVENSGKCAARTLDGLPCEAPALTCEPFCFHHSPAHAEERMLARRLGGKNAQARKVLPPGTLPVSLNSAADIRKLLSETVDQVRQGLISVSTANSVAYITSVALKLSELELSADVARMEKLLVKQQQGR